MNRFALSLITLVALFLSACQTTSNYSISAELLEKVERGNLGVASNSEEQERCIVPNSISGASFPLSESLVTEQPLGKTILKGLKILKVKHDSVSNKKELKSALEKSILEDKRAIVFLVERDDGRSIFVSEKTECVELAFASLLGADFQTTTTSRNENNTKALETSRVATDTIMPVISIVSSTADDRRGSIKGRATDNSAVAEVRVDGVVVPLKLDGSFEWQGFVPSGGLSVVIEAIDTAGLFAVQRVRLERGQLNQAAGPTFVRLDPFRGKTAKKNRNALALIVGVSDYKRTPDPAIYADKDAQYFQDYAAIKLGVPDNQIFSLVNDKADKVEITKAIKSWLLRMSVKDKTDVYVFFAGHGLASSDGSNMFLLPYDGDPGLLEDSAIDRRQLFADIQAISPRSVTVFLDSCYSGGTRAGGTLVASLRPIAIHAKEQNVPDGFTILSAAKGDQTSQSLEEAEHGLFSYFLMRGLEGDADANNDNQITAGELHSFVTDKVERQSGFKQTPDLQGDAGRVLVRFQ